MELKLRTLHPNDFDEFFTYVKNPCESQIEQAIRSPVFHHGQGRLGDVALFRYGQEPSSLRIYLGLPERALVVFQPYCDGTVEEYVRVCDERNDVFVVVPDMAADEYYNIPHKMLVPLEDAIDSAKRFLTNEGTSFAPESKTEVFAQHWIQWYEIDECMDPFSGAIQEHIGRHKKDKT